MQSNKKMNALAAAVSLALLGGIGTAHAVVNVQCPNDDENLSDAVVVTNDPGPNGGTVKCKHFAAGDGFAVMSDGHPAYTFGFSDITGTLPADAVAEGILNARWPGPTIALDQGDAWKARRTQVIDNLGAQD